MQNNLPLNFRRCNSMTKERKMFIVESKNKWKLTQVVFSSILIYVVFFIILAHFKGRMFIPGHASRRMQKKSKRKKKSSNFSWYEKKLWNNKSHFYINSNLILGPDGEVVVDDFLQRFNRPEPFEGILLIIAMTRQT